MPHAGSAHLQRDIYDALTADRPYRDAWSTDRAVAQVEEQAGRQFDPDVLEAFLHMHHELDSNQRT